MTHHLLVSDNVRSGPRRRTTSSWLRLVVICGLAAMVASPAVRPADAQVLYGSITGNVTDPQGGFIPGVTLTATNVGTGLTVEAVTDATGAYTFRNLPPGTYDLTAALAGFREHRQTGIPVTAGQPVRINVALSIGDLTEVVEVVSDTTLLQTDKADISTVLRSEEIVNLPLNQYRNYQTLINLVPGATPAQFQNAEIDTPGRSLRTWVNGTQPNSNATRIDGAVSVNIWLPHHVGYVQPAETIETVNISTNNFDADFGMAGGAAATLITKSGTNELRGSAFWFNNRDALNANSFFNNANQLPKQPIDRHIYGGTVGGPVVRNRVFYFGSFERFQDRRGFNQTFGVPTAAMRQGDFSEVAAAYPNFRLYNPLTGNPDGTGRELFPNSTIPANMIHPLARSIMNFYPMPNTTQDLNANLLLDDYTVARQVRVDRDNYDLKLTFQRSNAHSLWGKFATLQADVIDNFILGWDNGSLGDTRVYVGTVGHTWTLSPTLVLDGNFGINAQNQEVTGPDYGQNIGLELGIPGTNGTDIRQSGMPFFGTGYNIGTTPNWMPLFRRERSYTFSTAMTKVFRNHDLRFGVDVVRHELNHIQAEFGGAGGVRGGMTFSGLTTGVPGYTPLAWNQFGGFLMGLQTFQGKDVQTEEMTGREWQNAFFIRDRWQVRPDLTLSLGLRMEHYPMMRRADRGLERLDYNTYEVLIGGLGGVPEDVGINLKTVYFAPRVGAMYRINDRSVARVGYGRTINPLPWSRPLRGSFPQDIFFNRTAEQFAWLGTLADGIDPVPIPDISTGRVRLPQGVFMRSPNPDNVDRGIIQQWNVAYEHRLPWDISAEIAYVGTRTDGGYADLNLNYGEPGGGNPSRQLFDLAGTTAVNDWASRTRSRYHSMQLAVNRPFRTDLMLKGAYTLSRARNMADEDGWTGLTWNHPLMYDRNFALAGFDRTHIAQLGFVWSMPFFRNETGIVDTVLGGWQLNGVAAAYSGSPYSIGGTNTALNCPGCGSVFIDVAGTPRPTGRVGSATEPYYPLELFSQPTGLGVEGFGTSGRNAFRRPPVWNVDMSLFKTFAVGRLRPELRIEAANVFNHPNWGAPVTGFTAPNFMRFTPASVENATNTPGARRVQIGLRTTF
jgi:hypothetical protein